MTPPRWTVRVIAVATGMAVALALSPQAAAQFRIQPQVDPRLQPKAGLPKAPPIFINPTFNSFPGFPAAPFNPPAFNPGPFYNPALYNPWMNQTRITPVYPFVNPAFMNPFAVNPFVNNPFAVNPFVNNPFAVNPFVYNPFANPFINPLANSFGPVAFSTPPIAIQQPGYFLYRGPDLQVNPWSGTVYRPLSGVARTADGSLFFRVPGTGLPTVTGAYATGTGLYFDPKHNNFLNPNTGVISKPGLTNVFIPWIP